MSEVKLLMHKKVGENWVPVEQDDFSGGGVSVISDANPPQQAFYKLVANELTAMTPAGLDTLIFENIPSNIGGVKQTFQPTEHSTLPSLAFTPVLVLMLISG